MPRCSIVLAIATQPNGGPDGDYAVKPIKVEFSPLAPEPSIGIMGWSSEDHTLHDPKTGERLHDLEKRMPEEGWDYIGDQVDVSFDFYGVTTQPQGGDGAR